MRKVLDLQVAYGMVFAWLLVSTGVAAEKLRPFVLASVASGPLSAVVERTSDKLKQGGFQIVGAYAPYRGAYVLAVTTPELTRIAVDGPNAAWLAAIRVALTRVGDRIQVSYANPDYLRRAYRVDASLSPVTRQLRDVLGAQLSFGARNMTARKLRRYHYAFGMEYFDDQIELAEYPDYLGALRQVGEHLRKRDGGVRRVYQVDLPDVQRTLLGVAITQGEGSDEKVMAVIDKDRYRHTAHLPYEILIDGGKVKALHPRFRIAIDFPDLKMSGKTSFFQIMSSPDAIQQALTKAVGGEVNTEGSAEFFRE